MSVNPQPANTLRGALIIVGSIVLVGLIVYAVFMMVTAATRTDVSGEVSIDDEFASMEVTAEVTDVVVTFGDVDEATVQFDQRGANRNMSFDAQALDGTLVVDVVEHGWQPWFLGEFGMTPLLTITLPSELAEQRPDLALETDVGDVELDGDFGNLVLASSVGDLHLAGSAESVDVESSVGDVTVEEFSVAGEADFRASTGNVLLDLDIVPSDLVISTSVGDVELVLPLGDYRIDATTSVGDVAINVANDLNADTVIRIETPVGDITVEN